MTARLKSWVRSPARIVSQDRLVGGPDLAVLPRTPSTARTISSSAAPRRPGSRPPRTPPRRRNAATRSASRGGGKRRMDLRQGLVRIAVERSSTATAVRSPVRRRRGPPARRTKWTTSRCRPAATGAKSPWPGDARAQDLRKVQAASVRRAGPGGAPGRPGPDGRDGNPGRTGSRDGVSWRGSSAVSMPSATTSRPRDRPRPSTAWTSPRLSSEADRPVTRLRFDLDPAGAELAQRGQRRVAGAEIVEGDPDAGAGQREELVLHRLDVEGGLSVISISRSAGATGPGPAGGRARSRRPGAAPSPAARRSSPPARRGCRRPARSASRRRPAPG